MGTWLCPQHKCAVCEQKAEKTGGLLYRCASCAKAFCEDDLDWSHATMLVDILPEFSALGFDKLPAAFYVYCGKACRKRAGQAIESVSPSAASPGGTNVPSLSTSPTSPDENDSDVITPAHATHHAAAAATLPLDMVRVAKRSRLK